MVISLAMALSGCATTYYSAMDTVGIHKRDILVDRVEEANESQVDAQEQFQSALDQFESVVGLEETDLKKAYDKLSKEYERSEKAAAEVSGRIDDVESVAEALFKEWKKELKEYESSELRASSKKQMDATRGLYDDMIESMHTAEASMEPVLKVFHDNVLFLKHNLNAQAIGSLEGEFASLKVDIESLISQMNDSIEESNRFISQMKQG
jgi:uncharacterized protein YdiU (UPF0061 family)